MKILILAKCSRCGEQFIIPAKAGDSVLQSSNRESVIFGTGDKLVRHYYINGLEIDRNGFFKGTKTEILSLCKPCDTEYWKNFNEAVKVLESFWHEPIKGES
jgi:hypothetical protein